MSTFTIEEIDKKIESLKKTLESSKVVADKVLKEIEGVCKEILQLQEMRQSMWQRKNENSDK